MSSYSELHRIFFYGVHQHQLSWLNASLTETLSFSWCWLVSRALSLAAGLLTCTTCRGQEARKRPEGPSLPSA